MSEKAGGPPDEGREPRPVILALRGSREWKEWIDRLARHCRLTTATVVDQALVRYAKEVGFEESAPPR
jgi:hypothetical protein